MHTIYALMDPRHMTAFYVGVTRRPLSARYGSHLHDGRATPDRDTRCRRIADIIAAGLRPEALVLEEVSGDAWIETEQFWISQLSALGCRLTNKAAGGKGAYGARQTEQARERRREAAAGRDMSHLQTQEIRAKVSAATKGRKGRIPTAETRAKMSEAKRGAKNNCYGRVVPPETRAKIAATNRATKALRRLHLMQ